MMRLYLALEASRSYSSLLSKASSSLEPPEASGTHHRCHAGSGLFHIMLFLVTVSHPSEAVTFKEVTSLCLRTELPQALEVSRTVS